MNQLWAENRVEENEANIVIQFYGNIKASNYQRQDCENFTFGMSKCKFLEYIHIELWAMSYRIYNSKEIISVLDAENLYYHNIVKNHI